MVQDSAHIRQRGAQDFMAYYDFACARQESVPLSAVKMNLDKGMLDFNGDRVKLTDWPPILNSISINKHLHHIAISSTYQASLVTDRRYSKSSLTKKIPAIRSKDMTFKLSKALKECLTVSPKLKTLHLNGLPLRERDLITLTKGLSKSVSLENLSLANCPIADEGLEVICQSVKYTTSIRTVDFTGCSLTWKGAEHMAKIIKHQGVQRHGTAWAESLRYRQPQFEGMGGLRRVTLNCNTLIGDRGAAALAHELVEDLWVKAVDLQKCGLSSEGARRLLEALKTNSTLCVLDIRSNPLVENVLIKTVIEKVLMNAEGQSPEYCWIKPAAAEPQRTAGPKRRVLPGTVKGKATFRMASRKGSSPGARTSGVAQTQKACSRSRYVPWRAAARAERQRGMPPGVRVIDQTFQGAATVKVTVESDSEEDDEEEEVVVEIEPRPSSFSLQEGISRRQFEHIQQMELKECRLRLTEERRARLRAESKLIEFELENTRLRNTNLSLSEALVASRSASAPPTISVLEDETVLQSIENSFTKFHAFLDLLKDAGLGQLASLAGIDKTDFQPLGRPQLCSTVRPHLGDAASVTSGEQRDVGPKTDASSLAGGAPSAPSGEPAEVATTKSSARASLNEGSLLDGNFKQVSGPAVAPDVVGEGEPYQYSRPVTQHDSDSEHSFQSQRSFNKIYFGKTFQMQPDRPKSNSNSHRSYSSHGGLSGRSSISDATSEKAESVGSGGSRIRAKGRLVALGQSGSEESVCPGREILEQIRSFGEPGGQSDNESF